MTFNWYSDNWYVKDYKTDKIQPIQYNVVCPKVTISPQKLRLEASHKLKHSSSTSTYDIVTSIEVGWYLSSVNLNFMWGMASRPPSNHQTI